MSDAKPPTAAQRKRARSKAKRSSNRDLSAQQLVVASVAFESKNRGAHLIVKDRIDFWPGTGRWNDRQLPTKGFGVLSLIEYLGNVR